VLKIVFELEESGTKRELCYKTEYGKRFTRREALRLAHEQEERDNLLALEKYEVPLKYSRNMEEK